MIFKRARAEGRVDAFVRDHRDAALDERDDHLAADEILVAGVVRMHGDGDVPEDRRGTHRRDGDVSVAVGERIARVRQRVVDVLVVDLEVGDDARAAGAPVDDARPAVEVALVGEVDEEAHHRARVGVVEREAVAAVVERRAHRAQLPHDLAAVIAQELPALLHEALAPEVAVVDPLVGEEANHDALQRDRRVVVARLPESVEVAHAVPADERVLARGVQGVTHVQPAGDVRRRQADHERLARVVGLGVVEALGLPRLLPAFLDALGLVKRVHQQAFRVADVRGRGGRRVRSRSDYGSSMPCNTR